MPLINNNNKECPICLECLNDEHVVFECNHSHCTSCVETLMSMNKHNAYISCSICRFKHKNDKYCELEKCNNITSID